MGNQNANGMHKEDKVANQSTVNPSNNECSAVVEEPKDDQLILPTDEAHELFATSASGLSDHEPLEGAGDHHVDDQALDITEQEGYDEAQGIENEATDTKDDPKDQEIKDATLNLTGAVLHEPDSILHSDARVDDHILEKFNQDPSLHVRRESKLTSFNKNETSIEAAEGETGGLVDEHMLEAKDQPNEVIETVDVSSEQECKASSKNHPKTCPIEEVNEDSSFSNASNNEEFFRAEALSDASIEHPSTQEKAISIDEKTGGSDQIQALESVMDTAEDMLEAKDQLKEVIDTVCKSSEQECKTSSKDHPEMCFVEEVNKESISSEASHSEELFHAEALSDASVENLDTKEEAEGIKGMNCINEKIAESNETQVLESVMDTRFQVNASSANLLSCKEEAVEGSDDDQAFGKDTEESEIENGPELADFKDLEVDHIQEANAEDVAEEQQNTESQMEKSPSFNFGLVNWDKIEELDQTPVLYHKKLTTMKSFSTPGNAQLFIPLDRSDEEKTIKIVQERRRESNDEPRSPLHGFLKEKEETHLLKPQENHEKVENDQNLDTQKELQNGHGMEIVPSLAQGKEKRNKVKISGSYLSSICICCTGVAQLNADP